MISRLWLSRRVDGRLCLALDSNYANVLVWLTVVV